MMTANIKPALVYVRGNSNNSQGNQKWFIQQQVKGTNFKVIDTMSDVSSGTSDLSRPVLQQLFNFLRATPAIRDVIVYGPSRLSRRKVEVEQIVQRLKEMKVKVHYAEDGLGLENASTDATRFRRLD